MVTIYSDAIDINYDERCIRRLKRKRSDISGFEHSTCNHSLKKVVEGRQLGDEMIDGDYGWFLSHIVRSNAPRQSAVEEVNGDEDDEDDMDPQYSMFLKKLTKDGKSYVLEVSENDGVPVFLKYEVEDDSGEECDRPIRRKLSIAKKGEKIETAKDLTNVQSTDKVEILRNFRSLQGKERKISAVTKGCSRQKPILEDNGISEPWHKCDTETFMVDSCYQLFLKSIEKGGKCVAFVCNDGKRVIYEEEEEEEEEDECSSDSDVLVWDNNPYCSEGINNPFVTAKSKASIDGEGNSQFRKEVMNILRRPYNQKEYEGLLKEVNAQKPVGRLIDLRRRPISSSVAGATKSYLDHHRDVRKKIDAVQHERHKVLNILRGFFYWMKHVANEGDGLFKPWLDARCLAVLPASQ